MAWENRNGKQYYYRKRRNGRQVISEYIGANEFSLLLVEQETHDRERKRIERQAERHELELWLTLDREVTQSLDLCSELLNMALLLAGFHTHKGQWRRDRGRR